MGSESTPVYIHYVLRVVWLNVGKKEVILFAILYEESQEQEQKLTKATKGTIVYSL